MLKVYLVLIAFFALAISGYSQVTTASISGKVLDEKKEPLPGATIVAKHTPTGTTYGTVASSDGRFNLSGMRVGGPYVIEVSFVGYSSQKTSDLFLTIMLSIDVNSINFRNCNRMKT